MLTPLYWGPAERWRRRRGKRRGSKVKNGTGDTTQNGRKWTARGMEECERGGVRGQLRKASSCAPSILILSGLFAWGTHGALPHPFYPPDLPQSPSCPRYTLNKQRSHAMLYILPALSKNTSTQRNKHEIAHADKCREQISWTGKIKILILRLHLAPSVVPIEGKNRYNIKSQCEHIGLECSNVIIDKISASQIYTPN